LKKYFFIFLVLLLLFALFLKYWTAAFFVAVFSFAWLSRENSERTQFRFLKGKGFREINFDLGADPAQIAIAADGSAALFVTVDGAMSMRDASGAELWKRPLEAKTLAILPLSGGSAYYAVADEVVKTDARGYVVARLSFAPPQFLQSYRLLLSKDSSSLLLHTPWFLQFMDPDLRALGPRISCETTGHYMKYCALSQHADRVFFAGAKLLEEEQSTEARWASWQKRDNEWIPDWAQSKESPGNSHLRGLAFSPDDSAMILELYQEGYEFQVLNSDGSLRWRRVGGEFPILNSDASLILWENPFEGVTLTDLNGQKKLWSHKGEEKIRHKTVLEDGRSLLIEGRRLMRFDRQGGLQWEAWFQTDPYRFESSADGLKFALVRKNKGAILSLERA
jgi:hypothetical protein